MGLFGDLRRLQKQANEISANYDPAAQMRAGMAQMQQMQQSMQAQTADLELLRIGTPGLPILVSAPMAVKSCESTPCGTSIEIT